MFVFSFENENRIPIYRTDFMVSVTVYEYVLLAHHWFLPRCMECRHGLAVRILSVRLSHA